MLIVLIQLISVILMPVGIVHTDNTIELDCINDPTSRPIPVAYW